jgi:hypothetical protein
LDEGDEISRTGQDVISQAAPTDWMSPPKFEAKFDSHTARKIRASAARKVRRIWSRCLSWEQEPPVIAL